MKRGCQYFPMWSYLVEGSPRCHQGFLGVVKVSPKGCSTDSQKCPDNEKFGKIEGNAPEVDQRGAICVGVGGDTGWDVLGADPTSESAPNR